MFEPARGLNDKTIAADLERDGFAVIDFPDAGLDRLAEDIWQSLQPYFDWGAWKAGSATGVRVPDAWTVNESVRRIATNPVIIGLLSELYGRPAFPFQTLSFAVGTQQHVHADLVHFCARPLRFMCGVWVALEDIREEAGPLIYYAGSHKWPAILPEDVGAPQTDRSLTRHSQVTHYFFQGCAYFTPLTGESRQPVAIKPPER